MTNVFGRSPSRREFLATAAAAVAAPAFLARRLEAMVGPELTLPPLLARPAASSILIHARNGHDEVTARVRVWPAGREDEARETDALHAGPGDFLEWTVGGLDPGRRYEYGIQSAVANRPEWVAARGGFVTQRTSDESFTAALITDAHVGTFAPGTPPLQVTDDVIRNVRRDNPEFVIALGDNVAWGAPEPSRDVAQQHTDGAERAYALYRRHAGPLTAFSPHFGVIGNWEGETGKFPPEALALVGDVRRRFAPNPDHRTYPQGGSPGQDYYAFAWGPALFLILNVQSYTEPSGPLERPSADVHSVQDWTLGREQFAWFERTLRESPYPYNFVCIHHAVGGNGGNEYDTLYGRGGARAAEVGEQRLVHELMREHGVQVFFYGHDHVFVDDVVDGIHYALPGSFGAPWRFGPDMTGYRRYWPDAGHARLTVTPREARVEFINQAGHPFHAFTAAPRGSRHKRGAPAR
jgi:hypothetical protein